MTSSKSISSKSKLLVLVAALVLWVGTAHAGRKRVVVLEFEGPSAEKFHGDVVKLLKKSHSVISVDKWNAKAEELGADKVTEKNVKKVAKKLKLDGVVTGKVEKRRDEYIIRLKLRSGTTGEITGNSVQTKSESTKLDSQAKRDIKDELIAAIDELESNRDGGDEGEDEVAEEEKSSKKKKDEAEEEDSGKKSSGFGKKRMMDSEDAVAEEDRSSRKKKDDEEKKRKKDEEEALATKSSEDEETPREKKRKRRGDGERRTASSEDEDGGSVEESSDESSGDTELNLSPGHRAIDVVVGLSFTARRLNFTYASDLGKPPPGYKQSIPVAGALVDVTFFPMAFGHKPNKGIIEGLGLNVLYDQVLKINSQKKYADTSGMQAVADLKTAESRWAVGAVLRYPLGEGPKAIVVGGSLSYGKQRFEVQQTLPNNEKTDIPNVNYTMLTPSVFIQAPVIPKITLLADAAFHAITDTGAIQQPDQYGASTVTGFEINAGLDYALTKNIFARAQFRYETIGFKFKGDPVSMTHMRDTDPEQDVTGAKDTYVGGTATIGYLY